ncbi:MAG: hypothetical protein G01um101448_847 [Parcubacteria group bacterium Gr01-1014_48]|nr:MAG: hypothetical protein Greene041614_1003 [Parcubacteria group bacterium Greene0416_14]TSC73209.1 MAG: hypothetical protein G01um101448_847 [Parcubacteria group bacterium Gr01-1014_48]TSD00473.1 MAG: hypothetical protein Greene101415_822 [Parcubacteria group bacterium Greene1014_15]
MGKLTKKTQFAADHSVGFINSYLFFHIQNYPAKQSGIYCIHSNSNATYMFHELLMSLSPLLVALSLISVPATTQSSCTPAVSPKPLSEVQSNDFGTMTITPEISEAHTATKGTRREKDGIRESEITITVVPKFNAKSIIITDGPFFSYADLIDWGPQDPLQKVGFVYNSSNGSLIFSPITSWWEKLRKVEQTLPAHQRYWVKLRVSPTVPENSGSNIGSYGWSSVSYLINDHVAWRSGTGVYFVNGPQVPGVRISRIGTQVAPKTKGLWSLKPVVVKQNKTFEVEVEALGQSGTITIPSRNLDSANATIVGPQSFYVVANNSAIFNVQPKGSVVSLQDIEITSSCGSSRTNMGVIKIPIQQSLDPKTVPPIQPQPPTPLPASESRPIVRPTPPSTTRPVTVSIKSFVITPNRSLKGLVEGDKVFFTAVLGMSDGTQKLASGGTVWTVVGKMGTINQDGVFTAELDPSIAEIGEGVGVVTVIYTDNKGKTWLSKTETFKVGMFIPDDTETQG